MVSRTRKVKWTKHSQKERNEIFNYWNNRNKSTNYSKKLNKLFREKMNLVAENPKIGRKTQYENIFTVLVRDNVIIYEVYPQEILVVGVWEGHQNPENLSI